MKRSIKIAVASLPYLFVFIASLYLPKDPDLGWHLKYGEYFFTYHHILRDNIFSTMMPTYHWANGSWGTDIITYALYKTGGFLALTLAGAGVVTLAFFFAARAGKKDLLSVALLFPLFLFLLTPVNSDAFRGQQLSYLFLTILLFLLNNYKPFTKKFFLIPLLFLLWINIHEEAFLVLALFEVWVLIVIIKNMLASKINNKNSQKNENLFLLGIFLLSFLVTFINPFGQALLSNAWSYVGSALVKNVSEYEPYTLFSINWWGQIIVSVLLIMYIIVSIKKKLTNHFSLLVITAFLLLLGFSMRRYLWPAYYLTLSFISVPLLNKEKYREKYAPLLGILISLVALCIAIQYKLLFTQFTTMSWDKYCSLQSVQCSPQSAQFLQSHHLTGKVFSYYDWGGFLIWNYPTIKPSIDGRMHMWRDRNGYAASDEYDAYETAEKNIDTSSYDVVYLPNDTSPLTEEMSNLIEQKKWKEVYEDEISGIVVRVRKKN